MNMKTRIFALVGVAALAFTFAPNVRAQTWEYTLSLPAPHQKSIGLTATNGTLLSLGGLPLEGNFDLVYALAPGASVWEKMHRLTNDAAGLGAGIDALGRIIVFGGLPVGSLVPLTNGYVYETALAGAGAVAAIAPKNFAVSDFALAADDQRRIYAIGGRGGIGLPGADSRGVERYDALTDTWTVLAPLPSPRREATAVYDGLGHVLVFGGINTTDSTVTTTVFSYDIAGDTWSQLADVPLEFTGPVNGGAAVLGADGLVYLVGTGRSVFDPRLQVWFSAPQQLIVRGSPGATRGSDGFIYVMGGANNTVHGGLLDTVERLDTVSPALPAITSTAVTTASVGSAYGYQIIASGNPRPGYSLVSGPAGMSVNASNGVVSWTPSLAQSGKQSVTVRATNSAGVADQAFTINVVKTVDVVIANFAFNPKDVVLNVGDTVRWTQQDTFVAHTATSGTGCAPDGLWDSGFLTVGQQFSHTFNAAGLFPYYCIPHCLLGGMVGSVAVAVVTNSPPTVAITSPTNGASFPGGTSFTIQSTATASVPTATITQVAYFEGTTSLGVSATTPYSVAVTLPPGSHVLTAVATDNSGSAASSAAVTINVQFIPILDPIPEHIAKGDITIELQTVLDGLSSPLGLAVPDDGSGRTFVHDQVGLVWVLTAGGKLPAPLLDVRDRLMPLGAYDERGLLGFAVHPGFAQKPFIYTYTSEPNAGAADFPSMMPAGVTNNHQSVVAEWRVDAANSNRVDLASRREILRVDKPQSNHNGGAIHFGPDGFLYLAIGDGGNANDVGDGHMPGGNAQDLSMALGKMLRIDVNGTNSANHQYGVPSDNPFVGQPSAVGEIYAYGLRNPFSYSFDRATGELYLGDVGQNKIEEVDLIVKGGNYGWNIREGTFYFDPSTGNVVTTPVRPEPPGLVNPIAQYDHDEGTVVMGGFVYRGSQIAALQGRYVFGDWGTFGGPSGKLFYLDASNTIKQLRIGLDDRALGHWIKGFGQDANGELYVFGSRALGPGGFTATMMKIVPAPAPLTIASVGAANATNVISSWTGGTGPFAFQKKNAVSDPTWMNVAFTTNRGALAPQDTGTGFYRVADLSHQPAVPLSAYLSGAAQHPAVITPATGLGLFSLEGSTLRFNITYSGLTGSFANAHIHGPAPASGDAGVLIGLVPYANGPLGATGAFSGVITLTAQQQATVLAGRTYVNIHSSTSGSGEIRGQILPVLLQVGLSGANQVPNPVKTPGSGLGMMTLVGNQLTFNIAYRGLLAAANDAHIHGPAAITGNAAVLLPLAGFSVGPLSSNGVLSGSSVVSDATLAALADGLTYVNVHTPPNPGGEIRGQVMPHSTGVPLTASLSGAAQKPTPVTTAGSGSGIFSLEGNTLTFSIGYAGLSGPAAAAHIHGPATAAQTGGVLIDLAPYSVGPLGTNGAFAGTVVLTPQQEAYLTSGQTYVNIHTVANGAGEIRGQIAAVLMTASLSGSNERPNPVATGGVGLGIFALVRDQLNLAVTYNNLTSLATASHIHGPAGAFGNAGVLVDMAPYHLGPFSSSGAFSGSTTLVPATLGSVIDGLGYFNIHSLTNGGGELRGQVAR